MNRNENGSKNKKRSIFEFLVMAAAIFLVVQLGITWLSNDQQPYDPVVSTDMVDM